MGDTGSLVCGFIISVLAIQFIEMRAVNSSPAITLGILFVPLFDTMRVSVIRIAKGVSPFTPDKNHIHHRLLALGFRQINTVLILALINIVVICYVITLDEMGNLYLLASLVVFSILLSLVLGVYKVKKPARVSA